MQVIKMTNQIQEKKMDEKKRTKCERYSRVCGYLRPKRQWNDAKSEEWDRRKFFSVNEQNEN